MEPSEARLIPRILSFDLRDPRVGTERFYTADLGRETRPGLTGRIDNSVVVVNAVCAIGSAP